MLHRKSLNMRLLIPLIIFFIDNHVLCNQMWWPFTWLKVGMEPHRLSQKPNPSFIFNTGSSRPRIIDQYLRNSKHRNAVNTVHALRSFMPNFWNPKSSSALRVGGNGKIGRTVRRMIDPDSWLTPVVEGPNEENITDEESVVNNCNGQLSTTTGRPVDLKATTVARSCAPGDDCRIHLRSFETGDALFQYAYAHSNNLEPILQNIYDVTRGSAFAPPLTSESTVAPEVVKLCMSLVKSIRANRVLVVGVFTGLSVIGAALSVEYGGQVVGVEDPNYVKYWNSIGSKYAFEAGLGRNIVIQATEPVDEYLDRLSQAQPGTFDYVFLDDTNLENYADDYEYALRLLRPRGIMLINDVFVEGRVLSGSRYRDIRTETVDVLSRKVLDDVRLESAIMIPFGGGVIMLVKK